MKIISGLVQGTPEWHAHRAKCRNASDAPAMLGTSDYTTREQLMRRMSTGIDREIDDSTQRLFDRGHEIENFARALAEQYLDEELFPITATDDAGYMSASFDGITMDERAIWECKTSSAKLRAAIDAEDLPESHWPQVEQQLLISGAVQCLFTISDGTADGTQHMIYVSKPERRARLIAGWKQFDADLAAYQPTEQAAKVVAAEQETLPVVSVKVDGSLAVIDNLAPFGDALRAFVSRINKKPETDQDFADLEAQVKSLKRAETALDDAEASAISQTATIATLTATITTLRGLAKENRLMAEKLVKTEKEKRKESIVLEGVRGLHDHITTLNQRIGFPYMPAVPADFAGAIRGLKSLDSMKAAVGNALTNAKLSASEIADKIEINLRSLREHAEEYKNLFPDTASLVLKANEDMIAVIKARIAEHKERVAKELEAAREKIRAEETAKAIAEQNATTTKTLEAVAPKAAPAATAEVLNLSGSKIEIPLSPEAKRDQSITTVEIINEEMIGFTPAQLQRVLDFVRTVRVAA